MRKEPRERGSSKDRPADRSASRREPLEAKRRSPEKEKGRDKEKAKEKRRESQTAVRLPKREKKRPGREEPKRASEGAITLAPLPEGEFDSADAIVVHPKRTGHRPARPESPTDEEVELEKRHTPVLKAGSDEILFGKIALDCGYVDQAEIDQCVRAQKDLPADPAIKKHFLGEILIRDGFLTSEEANEIVAIQNKNLRKRYTFTGQPRENTLFGALVVAHGYATREQVNEVVRLQAEVERFDERISLGELLVECGYLKEAQVREILALQKKREYRCYKCREVFTISLYEFGQKIRCPHCRQVLVLPETPESKKVKSLQSSGPLHVEPLHGARGVDDSAIADIQIDSSRPVVEIEPESTAPPAEIEKAHGWYVALGGKIFGPQKLETLAKLIASGIFHRHDLFWHESMDDWEIAGEIAEFASLFQREKPAGSRPGAPPPAPRILSEADLERLLGTTKQLFEKGTLRLAEYQEIRRLLVGE